MTQLSAREKIAMGPWEETDTLWNGKAATAPTYRRAVSMGRYEIIAYVVQKADGSWRYNATTPSASYGTPRNDGSGTPTLDGCQRQATRLLRTVATRIRNDRRSLGLDPNTGHVLSHGGGGEP
jgi:hypothetical protein